MSRLRARALAAAVLAAAFAAAGSAHPVDKFHEIPVDDPAYRVVPGPGAGTGWDAAPSAVDAAVDAWGSDAASAGATGSRASRLTRSESTSANSASLPFDWSSCVRLRARTSGEAVA